MLHPQTSIHTKGQLLSTERPLIMGILNITPDSFFDGGKYQNIPQALQHAKKMLEEGADIIDVGGMSSRPGARLITAEEEWKRVLPLIKALHEELPEAIISIDTIYATTARKAVEAGAAIVNDISAGRIDPEMFPTVAALQVPYILMHMQGLPHNMQQQPVYEDVVREVFDFFIEKTGRLRELGLHDIILDPGFGFGKTLAHNYALLRQLSVFRAFDMPLLVGISRKSMINKVLHTKPAEALNGTTAAHVLALEQGANILRVHDVAPAREAIAIWEAFHNPTEIA